jgi:hypothetical protein
MNTTGIHRGAAISLAALAFVLSACASVGTDFNDANLNKLKPGVTSEAEAIRLLGAGPTSRTYQADGSYMAAWQHVSATFLGVTDNKLVYLMFDKNQIYTRLVSATFAAPRPSMRPQSETKANNAE